MQRLPLYPGLLPDIRAHRQPRGEAGPLPWKCVAAYRKTRRAVAHDTEPRTTRAWPPATLPQPRTASKRIASDFMQLSRLVILAAAGMSVAGCGSSTVSAQKSLEQRRVGDLARKCGESESAVEANINVFLRTAQTHGLHGSYVEAAEALDTVANYAEGHREAPDCRRLLAALVAVGKHPPKERVCFAYQTGRICFEPPSKKK
jgi:hypothetical protein